MHPRTEDLLSIRDGLFDSRWREHLDRCAECAARLARLEHTRDALRRLPMIEPTVAWSDVQARLRAASAAPNSSNRRRIQTFIGAAIAASVAIIALLAGRAHNGTMNEASDALGATVHEAASTTVDLASLIERSRRLDTLLQTMPARPHVERVSMAATLDTMEGRIQWLDYQLAYAGGDLDANQSQRLWQERVELMDSLVKVRYAQAGTMF